MKTISINHFEFGFDGDSTYFATYISPTTGRTWCTRIDKKRIDEARKNPTHQTLKRLMNYCKRNGVVNVIYLNFAY